MSTSYEKFLAAKGQSNRGDGFAPVWMPSFLYPFQVSLMDWALRQGRSAIFADCGLGKTPIQLVWAENVVRKTGGKVLIAAPLAVSQQTIREGVKFGVEVTRSADGMAHPGINVTNYERLERFNPSDFVGAVCDESSILKSFDGAIRGRITAFMRQMRYRLLCTATAAPNDYPELGTSSEALGYLGHVDMLNRFFINARSNSCQGRQWAKETEWRFRGHAEMPFWRWVCSWARAIRRPSDLEFDDGPFVLPALDQREHIVTARSKPEGRLFSLPTNIHEEREERRRTIAERCERVADLVADGQPALVWCHLNAEGDLLERLIPDAVQVSGSDSDEAKEERLLAFAEGKARVLVTKPKIGAWGLNFQRCAHVCFFPSHSFEQFYQGVRRCWRFGQTRPVVVDIVTTAGERGVLANMERKATAADVMFARIVTMMNQAMAPATSRAATLERIPTWL